MIRSRSILGLLAAAFLAILLVLPATANAHGFSPGVLTLTEESPGEFAIVWTPPVDTSRPDAQVEPVFPSACTRADDRLDCGTDDLRGEIAFPQLESQRAPVTVLVRFLDGRSVEAMVEPADPVCVLEAPPGSSARAWIALGVHHIFSGIDHLAFLVGLLLVVGTAHVRRVVATVTAFTLAHSITLGLAATGVVRLDSAPVEASIAASVLLVAHEGLHDRPTLTRRAPWAVAFIFGLVHGLGFAGALLSAGLPADNVGWRLLCFNVGVELGQLAIVLAILAIVRVLPREAVRLRPVVGYAIGGAGAWWFLERVLTVGS